MEHNPYQNGFESMGRIVCREAEKEKGLLEKRLQRLEEARAAEQAQAGAQLQKQRDAVAAEVSAKDNKINDLVEELGATQALLTEKEHALQEVTLCHHADWLVQSTGMRETRSSL